MKAFKQPVIGQIVKVMRGRDQDTYSVIVEVLNERFVRIADGKKRKFDCSKQKNLLHLKLQDTVSSEVEQSLMESGRVTNSKLRFVIQQYIENLQTEAQGKGE